MSAALNVADGTVIGQWQSRPRRRDWLKFLQMIDEHTPAESDLHLILDNYAPHKHSKVKRWLEKHPRFHPHFTPTGAALLNRVERFFRDLSVNRLTFSVFQSLPDLITALEKYLAQHNEAPKPFVWTAQAKDIVANVTRARKKLNQLKRNANQAALHSLGLGEGAASVGDYPLISRSICSLVGNFFR
jgi:transposase